MKQYKTKIEKLNTEEYLMITEVKESDNFIEVTIDALADVIFILGKLVYKMFK